MSTDVFDLAPHEQTQWTDDDASVPTGSVAAEPVTPEWISEDLHQDDLDKLPYLSWLWRHHVPGDEFYPLAHLVLTGGPGDVWARKTLLVPSFVARDIAEFYAVGRPGITKEHLDLANKAVYAWRDSTETVSDLVARRRRVDTWKHSNPDVQVNREVKTAQTRGFTEIGVVPHRPGGALSASAHDVVPAIDIEDEQMPEDFAPVLVRCLHQYKSDDVKICGRPSVPGSLLCAQHGGAGIAYTHEELKEVYNGARQRLLAATLMAVDATIELARSAVNETVRLKAAEVILDRTGFVPGVEIHLPGQTRDGQIDKTPAQIVLERLNQLGIAAPVTAPSSDTNGDASDESDVVEAEVVEERP
jgi:hypothetical protein